MKVLLLADVKKVGRKGEIVDLAPGLVQNMLIPQGLAKIADEGLIRNVEKQRAVRHADQEKHDSGIVDALHLLNGKTITIISEASENGNLYRAIHIADVLESIKKDFDVLLDKDNFVDIGPWKSVGEYDLHISFQKVKAKCLLHIQVK